MELDLLKKFSDNNICMWNPNTNYLTYLKHFEKILEYCINNKTYKLTYQKWLDLLNTDSNASKIGSETHNICHALNIIDSNYKYGDSSNPNSINIFIPRDLIYQYLVDDHSISDESWKIIQDKYFSFLNKNNIFNMEGSQHIQRVCLNLFACFLLDAGLKNEDDLIPFIKFAKNSNENVREKIRKVYNYDVCKPGSNILQKLNISSSGKKLPNSKKFLDSIMQSLSDNKSVVEDEENHIEKFKNYYLDKIKEYKKDAEITERIKLRTDFNKEYPISRIANLNIEEYALGTDNYKETLSHKLEYGKYFATGCGLGGNSAAKHGFYKKEDGNFYGIKNEIIDNPNEYWKKFIKQLSDFYEECKDISEPLRASSKYPLLKGMNMTLTKVLFLYYPTKFLSICSRDKLIKLMKYFGYEYNRKMQAEELNYLLNKNLRNDIKELQLNDPQYMGDALWDYLNDFILETDDSEGGDNMSKGDVIIINQDRISGGYNKIVYGIPGCGKSYYVKHSIVDKDKVKGKVFTTTFYPDYTNGDFIGQIIPKLNRKDETSVMYDIQAGPFAEALLNAIIVPNKNTYLVVEEINRGNAAAIFGDMFQLLDRSENGMSQYAINNYLISTYLHKMIDNKYAIEYDLDNIKLPSNLILIGTMNTSDQNVFTLDTAFKRRWKMEYIKNDVKTSKFANEIIPLSDVTWAEFVEEINNYITSDNGLDVNGEDKQIGAYFISDTEWKEIKETTNSKVAAKIFAEKLLSYIWEDVAKINKDAWFDKEKYRTLDSLVTGFMEKGLEVFNDNISFTRDNNGE